MWRTVAGATAGRPTARRRAAGTGRRPARSRPGVDTLDRGLCKWSVRRSSPAPQEIPVPASPPVPPRPGADRRRFARRADRPAAARRRWPRRVRPGGGDADRRRADRVLGLLVGRGRAGRGSPRRRCGSTPSRTPGSRFRVTWQGLDRLLRPAGHPGHRRERAGPVPDRRHRPDRVRPARDRARPQRVRRGQAARPGWPAGGPGPLRPGRRAYGRRRRRPDQRRAGLQP